MIIFICNPSHYCKHGLNLNVEGVNLNVIVKHEYSIIFLYIVRNFEFMSDFGKLRQFFYIFSFFIFLVFLYFTLYSLLFL